MTNTEKSEARDCSLDNFRGLVILLLVFFFFYETLQFTPVFFLHSTDGEALRYADFIAPGFMFALVFAFIIGMEKYKENGNYKAAVKKYFNRYLAFIGAGFLITAIMGAAMGEMRFNFNVFTAFGVSGLYSLFFIKLNRRQKLIAGFALLAAYQFLLQIPSVLNYVLANDFGGLAGTAAWCGFMLIAMFLAEIWRNDFKQFTRLTIVFILIAVLFMLADIFISSFFLASKIRASFSYLMISLGVVLAVFWIFARFTKNIKIPIFTWYGRNSFLMYLFVAGAGKGLSALANNFVTAENIGVVLLCGFIVCTALSSLFAWLLYRNKIIVTV